MAVGYEVGGDRARPYKHMKLGNQLMAELMLPQLRSLVLPGFWQAVVCCLIVLQLLFWDSWESSPFVL